MKKQLLAIVFFFLGISNCLYAQVSNSLGLIPEPVSIQIYDGQFVIDNTTVIVNTGNNQSISEITDWLVHRLRVVTGYNLPVVGDSKKGRKEIQISFSGKVDKSIGNEGYQFKSTSTTVSLSANAAAGLFYGMQTLLQLLPPEIESTRTPAAALWAIPCVQITDYPRFGWRGLMLDVSRHFFTKDEVKKFIDQMVKYKYNVFHWHLCDDNGWRIDIKSLPQLTRVGAWRVERTGQWGVFLSPLAFESASQGGFYTQEEIKEVIAYAQKRNVTVLPEIDVPGHSLAMIATYPNLSCTGLRYSVNPGSPFYRIEDNVLCVGNDSIYIILDKVFTEVASLFPCKYIHIGGDEAFKGFWRMCPKCQKRMTDEHLKNEDELQSYFVHRMEKLLQSKGKQLIGWDEILQGGLAPEATVMSWRGMKGGTEAAKMKHPVVMCPWANCYLDLYQGEPTVEPLTYGMSRISNSYRYDPVPDSVDEKYILGGQGNLWTESVSNYRHVEYMIWPRSLALAEVYWSPKSKRNWDGFVVRMEKQFVRFDTAQIKYARSVYNVITSSSKNIFGQLEVKLSTEINGLDIYYTFDNSNPDNFYPKYKVGQVLTFPGGATFLNIVTYSNGKVVGKQVNLKKEELEKRVKVEKNEF